MIKSTRKIFLIYFSSYLLLSSTSPDSESQSTNEKIPEETILIRDFFNDVDLLKITTMKQERKPCSAGGQAEMVIEGQIGPDARHAIFRLLENLSSCRSSLHGHSRANPVVVSLRSPGGYMNEAYRIGKIFREFEVTTLVESGHQCVSSCAIAFLGGKKRILEDGGTLIFHAPHYVDSTLGATPTIDCEVGREERRALLKYFARTTDVEVAKHLFDRTMEHCSIEHGWRISNGSEAVSNGISTDY